MRAVLFIVTLFAGWVEAQEIIKDNKKAFERVKYLASNLKKDDRAAFDSSLLAFSLQFGDARNYCAKISNLGYVSEPVTGREDKKDAVINICATSMYWAANTATHLMLLQAVLPQKEYYNNFEGLFAEVARYQNQFAGQIMFHKSSLLPSCPEIWSTYFLVNTKTIGDCRNKKISVNSLQLKDWFVENINKNKRHINFLKSDEDYVFDQQEMFEFVREINSELLAMIFDRVVMHEIGHVVRGHHRIVVELDDLGAFKNEIEADKFADSYLASMPEYKDKALLYLIAKNGISVHFGMHNALNGNNSVEKHFEERFNKNESDCAILKMQLSSSEDNNIKNIVNAAIKALACKKMP